MADRPANPMCRAIELDVDGVPTTFYVRGIGEPTDAGKEVLIACAREMAKRLPPCKAPCWPGGPPCGLAPGHPGAHHPAAPAGDAT